MSGHCKALDAFKDKVSSAQFGRLVTLWGMNISSVSWEAQILRNNTLCTVAKVLDSSQCTDKVVCLNYLVVFCSDIISCDQSLSLIVHDRKAARRSKWTSRSSRCVYFGRLLFNNNRLIVSVFLPLIQPQETH